MGLNLCCMASFSLNRQLLAFKIEYDMKMALGFLVLMMLIFVFLHQPHWAFGPSSLAIGYVCAVFLRAEF